MANIQDLFIERFEEAGRRYLHKGTWHDTEIQADTIHVRGQDAPEQVTIHRAKRIAARPDAIEPLSIETMSPIMMDQSSAAVHLFRDHLSRHEPQSGETAALCQQLLDWDGVMEKAAIGGVTTTPSARPASFRTVLGSSLVDDAIKSIEQFTRLGATDL